MVKFKAFYSYMQNFLALNLQIVYFETIPVTLMREY